MGESFYWKGLQVTASEKSDSGGYTLFYKFNTIRGYIRIEPNRYHHRYYDVVAYCVPSEYRLYNTDNILEGSLYKIAIELPFDSKNDFDELKYHIVSVLDDYMDDILRMFSKGDNFKTTSNGNSEARWKGSLCKMSFNDMVKMIRNGTRHIIVKSQNPVKHLWIKSEEYAEDIISDIKRNGHFDYCSNIRDFLETGLADDMYVKEGNKYYLIPSQFDEYAYQFRLYDGTLITNVYEKTPLRLSDIARAVSDTGYGFVVYKDATVEIDESYYNESNEILYYVYV